MNETITYEWSKTKLLAFRLFTIYFFLYILFISDFISFYGEVFPLLQNINKPFLFITGSLMNLINSLFFHHNTVENFDFGSDTFWGYISALSFFFIAVVISFLWTLFSKRKRYPVLFKYVHTIARYYLAFVLFNYGMVKIFGNQFGPNSQNALIYSLPDLSPHKLFWSFMGVSKSYQAFAGILEIIPAILLLFRRTSSLAGLIAFSVILNVLMLNIGYDVRLKLFLVHLIIIIFFILAPSIKKLYNFFVLNQKEEITKIQPVIENNNLKRLRYTLKFGLIFFILFLELKTQIYQHNKPLNAPHFPIVGIHKVRDFNLENNNLLINRNSSTNWKKIAVTPFARFSVQFMNDSIATYFYKTTPTSDSFELESEEDSSLTCKLHYSKINQDEWLFNGTINQDSLHFISTKIELGKTELLKNFGKTIWIYNE